jgi:hypothetical protein
MFYIKVITLTYNMVFLIFSEILSIIPTWKFANSSPDLIDKWCVFFAFCREQYQHIEKENVIIYVIKNIDIYLL